MQDLVHLALIWGCVYLSVIAARKTKLTPMLYFLAFGCVLVNLHLLPEQSTPFIRSLGELGIIVIMFALGFEENSATFIRSIKRSWGIALFGALAPFFTAYYIADYFWQNHNLSLMFGLAMTATAVSLTMVSLKSEGLHKSPAATGIMTSAVLDDIGSLAMVAILVPIASGDVQLSTASVIWIIVKAVAFFALVSIAGQWIFPRITTGWIRRIPLIGQFGISDVLDFAEGEHATLTLLLLAVLTGLLSHEFGFHPAVGAYMAGLILREEYFNLKWSADINHYKMTQRIIDNVAFSWLGPVFFVALGAKLVIDWNIFLAVLPHTLCLTVGIMISQIASAALAARYTAGFNFTDSLLIGLGMLGRAELAFVVIDIAYVEKHIFSEQAFYTLMFSAFWLNISVPLSIRYWKSRWGQFSTETAEQR